MSGAPGAGRAGFNLIGVVLLIFIVAGAGLVYSRLARQAGRSSHWFTDSQRAYALADAGLKEAAYWLDHANSAEKAAAAPVMKTGLVAAFAALQAGTKAGPITLVEGGDAATLTESLAAQLAQLSDRSASLDVKLFVEEGRPLWEGNLQGVPADPREHSLTVTLVARASIKAATGIRVERTITADRGARVLSLLPPIVGRFALFVHPPSGGQDTNVLNRRFDPASGDAYPEGPGSPLVIQSGVAPPIVPGGTNQLDRSGFVAALPDTKFLDHQGWVFLGGRDDAPWRLNLAHGYSAGGESPLLPGDRARHAYGGNPAADAEFAARYDTAWLNQPGSMCLATLKADAANPNRGLYLLHHGTATNYEIVGLEPSVHYQVQAGGARRKFDFGNLPSSALRLFGNPSAFSPTLVFGPVMRSYFRRADLLVTLGQRGNCPSYGTQFFAFQKLSDHAPRTQAILRAAFEGDQGYAEHGSGLVAGEPFVESLNVVLDHRGSGVYGPDGKLYRLPPSGTARPFTSDRLQGLGALPVAGGLPDALVTKFLTGEVDVPGLYKGNLHAGFAALNAVLGKKLVYTMTPDAFRGKVLAGGVLRLPGIALVEQAAALDVGPITRVETGGILLSRGPIRITGDLVRGSAREPLTLISLSGGITFDPAVKTVEAHLVALGDRGKLALPPGPLTITGGVAARELDVASLQGGTAARVIQYVEDMDPLGPNKDTALRVFYGVEPRVSVEGAAK